MGHCVLGRKVGMTQLWGPEGNRLAITLVQVGPCTVTRVKTKDGKDGYNAVQIAYEPVPDRKVTKPVLGSYKKLGVEPHRHLREFRVREEELGKYEPGMSYSTDFVQTGNFLDVVGTSKGRGFTGVVKKYGYHGADAGHGSHESFRHVGTGGQGSATPGRVPKGKKRPGQHGNKRISVQNVLVVQVDYENRLVYLQGSIPGPNGGIVQLHEAIKTPDR